jgi:hypothetical protein
VARSIKSCQLTKPEQIDGKCLGRNLPVCLNCSSYIDYMPDTVYMATTQDKYELPVFVADSWVELSHAVGESNVTIRQRVGQKKCNQTKGKYKYMKVDIGGVI